MAHEISNVGFGNEVFTAGKPAWHGLGANVREAVTSVEAMQLAGLDWKVLEGPVYGLTDIRVNQDWSRENLTRMPGKKMTFRLDAEEKAVPLGVVGEDFKVVQNAEAFDFMDGLIGDGAAAYETAGALHQGRRVWMLCRIPGDIVVGDERDVTRKYLLLANGHDGSMALKVFFTPIRVVCANTLAAAFQHKEKNAGVSIRHSGDVKDKVKEAREVLGLAVQHYDDLGRTFNRFVKEAITKDDAREYFQRVLPATKDKEASTRVENARDAMLQGFERGRGAEIAGRTVWGAYNAVAEYATHTRHETRSRASKADASDRRFEAVMFGSDKALTERAFSLAAQMVGIKD